MSASGSLRSWLRPARVAGPLVILLALALYLATLDNGLRLDELQGGDLITHQYAQVQARPSNAPGYPLFTMGGWLWFRAGRLLLSGWFNPIEILSLYSTLWAIASLATLYLLIRELTDDNWPVAAACTLYYAFTYFFWYYSVSTEQYTSAVFQTLLLVLWAFRWDRTRRDRYLYLIAFMVGLSLANLVTVLFVLPPILVFILSAEPRLVTRGRLIFRAATLALVPLASYAFVYIRGAQHPEWRGAGEWQSAWHWFVSFVSTQQGRDEMTWTLGPLTAEFPGLIVWDLSAIGVVLALIGWALLGLRRGGVLYGSLAIYLLFSYFDRHGNWYQVFMPMYPLLIVGVAVAADRLWQWAVRRQGTRWTPAFILLGLLALAGSRLVEPDPRALQHNRPDDDGLLPGRALLADEPAAGATIIGDGDQFVSLAYLTEIWGERPDVRAARLSEADGLLREGREPLYTTRVIAPLLETSSGLLHLEGNGEELVRLRREAIRDLPAEAREVDLRFGADLRLAGIEARPRGEPANGTGLPEVWISLFWQAEWQLSDDWSVSVRPTMGGQLIPAEGGGIVQKDAAHPVAGLYPTSRWTPGEIVRDDYVIPLAPDQRYDGAQIVVYRADGGGFQNLGTAQITLTP